MSFQSPRHQQSASDPIYANDNYYSAANAVYSTGQTLSSTGASTGQWPTQKNPAATAPDPRPYQQTVPNGPGSVIPYRPGPMAYNSPNTVSNDPTTQFQTPRRTLTIGRQPEELHLSSAAMSDVHHYGAPPAYSGDGVAIHLQPSTPQHPNSVASNPVPGALQPGQASRPVPIGSSNTAPTLPTLPQITTQMQQPPLSARPPTLTHTHSYSRSSPGVMDQPKYKPFSNTPEQSKYVSPTANYMPQTPQAPPSYSPLGLADIRPRADTILSDTTFSPNTAQDNDVSQYPSSSDYIAPWPIYAVDWCKWPPRSNSLSCGKVAIGSYLEDTHNYVR